MANSETAFSCVCVRGFHNRVWVSCRLRDNDNFKPTLVYTERYDQSLTNDDFIVFPMIFTAKRIRQRMQREPLSSDSSSSSAKPMISEAPIRTKKQEPPSVAALCCVGMPGGHIRTKWLLSQRNYSRITSQGSRGISLAMAHAPQSLRSLGRFQNWNFRGRRNVYWSRCTPWRQYCHLLAT